jgi:enterobactin synthetase component D
MVIPNVAPVSFISEEGFVDWFGGASIPYYCWFDNSCYEDSLFDSLHIHFPSSLSTAVVKRKAEFLAGRYCVRRSLEKSQIFNISVGTGKNRNPVWPSTINGSISHCDGLAVAVTGYDSENIGLGIDVENVMTRKTMENILSQVADAHETTLISSEVPSVSPQILFTLMFSVKESYFKAAYPLVGKYFAFDAVSLLSIDWKSKTIFLRINQTLHPILPCGATIKAHYELLPDNKVATFLALNRDTFC